MAILLALAALAIPASASANWIHKGQGELKSNASLGLKGDVTLSTTAGDVVCAAELGTTLTGSSTSGHVNSFTVSKPSECNLTGSLAAICGTNGVTKVEKTGTWAMTADETVITVSEVDIHYTLGGCLIPGFRVKGSMTATPNKASAISTATLGGKQDLYNALGEKAGTGELKGTLTASPGGTFALASEQPEFEWETNGVPITEHDTVVLEGETVITNTPQTIGLDYTVAATLTLFNGSHAIGDVVATVAELHLSNCKGTINLAGTTCTSTSTAVDWDVTLVAPNTLEIDHLLHLLFWAGPHTGSPVATTTMTGGVLAEIGEAGEVETAALSTGEEFWWNGSPVNVEGALVNTGANALAIT